MNLNDDVADSFYRIVTWLVEDKEKTFNDHKYRWTLEEIEHIKIGLSFVGDKARARFMDRYRDFQIVKALAGDETAIR